MPASDRRGWSYSFFAAAFACALQATLFYFFGRGISSPVALAQLIFVTIDALISARLGGLLAVRLGTIDHGFWAGAITWWIFSLLLSIFFFAQPNFVRLRSDTTLAGVLISMVGQVIGGVFGVFYFSSLVVAPACFIGTALFLLLLRAVGKGRH
jgi:hypothetical protein